MPNIIFEPYSREELKNPDFYNKIFKEWEQDKRWEGEFCGEKPSRYIRLMRCLDLSLKERNLDLEKEILAKYQNLLLELKFFLLPHLDSKEIINLFRNHFVFISQKKDIDVKKKLKIAVQGINRMGKRDPFLSELRKALAENKETVGFLDISLNGEKARPYLSNWILDFERYLGAGKHNFLEITNYFFKSPNAKLLTMEERNFLRKIFDFYEHLKLTAADPDSLSSYPLYVYGFKKVGTGIKTRYLPNTPQVAAYLLAEEEMAVKKKKAAVAAGPVLERKTILEKRIFQPSTKPKIISPSSLREEVVSKPVSAPLPPRPKKLEEGLGGKPIPKETILKLNSKEGLASLSVEDFRVFSSDPREAARFIFRKIKKLVLSQPYERAKIREAFLNSILYKLYLSQGKEAIDSTKTIGEVAEMRRQQRRPHLTEEEYKAVGAVAKAI
jgi:hypothetical protein